MGRHQDTSDDMRWLGPNKLNAGLLGLLHVVVAHA
jgi:hypothetical protein